MKVKNKYPVKVGKVLVPANTIGEVLTEPTQRMIESFPKLTFKPRGECSIVKFPDHEEILLFTDQLIKVE